MVRIGHGYDVHRLAAGRKLILGGAEIPYTFGLAGHSDADVLTHAVMDALLGACAMGDIGQLFPDTDDRWKDADSIEMLKTVAALIGEKGYKVGNIDCTVICQHPALAPFYENMKRNISEACGVDKSLVNVKATTEEKLGFTGAGEGIAAHAVCTVRD